MKLLLPTASILGLLSVIMGAMGNHLLGETLSAERIEHFEIALRYHQLYSILLVALSLYALHAMPNKLFRLACLLLLFGMILFSGSLYLSAFLILPILKYGTPLGGILLMLGWLLLGLSSFVDK